MSFWVLLVLAFIVFCAAIGCGIWIATHGREVPGPDEHPDDTDQEQR